MRLVLVVALVLVLGFALVFEDDDENEDEEDWNLAVSGQPLHTAAGVLFAALGYILPV